MNRTQQSESEWDDRAIGRLVDGEILEEERTALLQRLEASPDGWRRCALAFLEAQAWREAMTSSAFAKPMFDDFTEAFVGDEKGGHSKGNPSYRIASPGMGSWRLVGTIAACVVASFVLGRASGTMTRPTNTPHQTIVQGGTPPKESQKLETAMPIKVSTPVVDRSETPQGPFKVDPEWLAKIPKPLPENVLRQLRQRGYEVEESEAVLSMGLDDGQQVSVPVDEVKLRYIGDYAL